MLSDAWCRAKHIFFVGIGVVTSLRLTCLSVGRSEKAPLDLQSVLLIINYGKQENNDVNQVYL